LRRTTGALILFAALIFAYIASPPQEVAAQNAAIRLTLEVGYEGYYRADSWLPVLVRVANGGADISGELHVMSVDVLGKATDPFIAPIDLPTRSEKQLFLYLPADYTAQTIRVNLVTPERIVASSERDVKPARPSDMLFAVVTDSPTGTIDLKAIRSGVGDAYQATWRVENLPRLAESLRALDGIVLNDVDSGALGIDQRQALTDWVLSGGHLVVTGGSNWRRTAAGVKDILPLVPERITTLRSMPSVASFAGRPAALASPNPFDVAEGTLTAEALVLAEQGGVPLVVRRAYGAGFVDVLAFDPNFEPFSRWGDRGQFWFTLFTTAGSTPSWAGGVTNTTQSRVAADTISGLRLPDVAQLAIFLGLYIALIGPVNYVVLRLIKRQSLAWFTIPLIVTGFTTVYILTGASLRGTQAIINRMAIVQVWENTTRGQVDAIIGVAVPRRGTYSLSIGDNYTLRPLNDTESAGLISGRATTIYEVGGYEARNLFVDAGTTAAFGSSGFTDVLPLEGEARIMLSPGSSAVVSPTPGAIGVTISGRVKNTTNQVLYYTQVIAHGGAYTLGTLNPGDETTFSFPMNADLSPPASLGSNIWASAYFRAGRYNNTPSNITVRQIMGMRYLGYRDPFGGRGFENADEQQEDLRRQRFLESIITDSDPSGGRGTSVYVTAFTRESPVQVALSGVASVTEDTTVYIYRLPVTVTTQDPARAVELPNAYLTWTPTEQSTRRDVAPYEMSIQPGERYVFRYIPMPLMRMENVTEIRLTLQPGNSASRSVTDAVSLYNWQRGEWEVIQTPNFLTRIIDAGRFIGPENAIEMKVEVTANVNRLYYERIDLTLYGTLREQR